MILTQNAAAKKAGVTRQMLYKLSRQTVRPGFFLEANGKLMVDDDHPEFKLYLEKQRVRAMRGGGAESGETRMVRILISFLRDNGWSGDQLREAVHDLQQRFNQGAGD